MLPRTLRGPRSMGPRELGRDGPRSGSGMHLRSRMPGAQTEKRELSSSAGHKPAQTPMSLPASVAAPIKRMSSAMRS
eukprot:6488306-Pyramimonas_sp.AAC.1